MISATPMFLLALPVHFTRAQSAAPAPGTIRVADGFRAELVFEVPNALGSWVSMTTTPAGLIASDQYGKLYRIQPGETAAATRVEPVEIELGHAQGLLWAFDSLYVMSHGSQDSPPGLYRVQDSDADGKLDQVRLLRKIQGGGEHGPHAIILSPDRKSLYVCAGNHTRLPEIQSSQVPQNWQEDNLIRRMWDPGGHAVGIMAPGGWICKTDPKGRNFELVSIGFRNQYDIAFASNGELFSYDADMEWDIGTPWYRPTRVCHVTAGSEFGWRGGDAKWPTYYPDSVPPVLDIGPGSPTGVVFGTGAHFPEKYQHALFIADWSFGFIYAVHLQPDGGTWTAEKELFCSAPALQVTDMVVHEGALYFAIGGRRTLSALYRITADTPVQRAALPVEMTPEQKLRRAIEVGSLGDADPADFAWPHLKHADRAVRYAARVQLERTPLANWLERALEETDTTALLEALLAVCRCGERDAELQQRVWQAIEKNLAWDELDESQRLHLLRICGLLVMRLSPESAIGQTIHQRFGARYPAQSVLLNRELCRLLVATGSPDVVPKTLALIERAVTQEEQILYIMCLRVAEQGWTTARRRQYLQWFIKSAVFQGGKSFSGYLKNARNEFVENLPEDEKQTLASLIETGMSEQNPYAELEAREVVRDWAVEDLMPAVEAADLDQRDLENGKRVFAVAQCYKCHQFAGSGGIVGPDLTGLSRRYTTRYLLETLVDPNKEISDQYQATVFEMSDGKMVVGRVANLNGNTYMVQEDMIAPGKLTNIDRREIESSRPSRVSPMPEDLLNSFTQDEILDLLGYLKSVERPGEPGGPALPGGR